MNTPYVFKKCSKCGEWLVACKVNFYRSKSCKYRLQAYCKKCGTEQQKQYRKNNKEQIAEQQKQWREQNKERCRELKKRWDKNNKDKKAEHDKKYRESHKEQLSEKKKLYYEKNKEYLSKYKKRYHELNREIRIKKSKENYQKNKERILQHNKENYQKNKERILQHNKQYRQSPRGQVVQFNAYNNRRLKEQNQGSGITEEQWLEMMKYFNWECAYSGECIGYKNTRSIDHITPISRGGEHEIWNVVPMYRPYNSSKQDKDLLEWYKEQDFYSEERLQKIYEWQEYAFTKYGK